MSTKIPADSSPGSLTDAFADSPSSDVWTRHHLSANPGTKLAVPTSLIQNSSPLPARRQDPPHEAGLVNRADILCQHFLQTEVEAHAITRDKHTRVNDGDDSGIWLPFKRGEPLLIPKESVPLRPTNHRKARLVPPSRSLVMVSLKTGQYGLVPLPKLILRPQAKVSGKEVRYLPQGTRTSEPNTMNEGDILTLAGHLLRHPDLELKETQIIFAVNHRTLQYGFIDVSGIVGITDSELEMWKKTHLSPSPPLPSDQPTALPLPAPFPPQPTTMNLASVLFRTPALLDPPLFPQSPALRSDEGYCDSDSSDDALTWMLPAESAGAVKAQRTIPGVPEWRRKCMEDRDSLQERRLWKRERNMHRALALARQEGKIRKEARPKQRRRLEGISASGRAEAGGAGAEIQVEYTRGLREDPRLRPD